VFGFSLWFAPGWANGWPVSKHVVWATGMAAIFTVGLLCLATACGAFYALARSDCDEQGRIRKAFTVWIVVSVAVSIALGAAFGCWMYEGIVQVWP
jgi:hypothetical protein